MSDHKPLLRWTQQVIMPEGATDPEEGGEVVGDCLRAAVASLLGVGWDDVPHFATIGLGAERGSPEFHCWWYSLVGWAASLNPPIWVEGAATTEWPTDDEWLNGCCIASGPSPRGPWLHSVVARRGVVVWDPHPSRSGLPDGITDLMVFRPLVTPRPLAKPADLAAAAGEGS